MVDPIRESRGGATRHLRTPSPQRNKPVHIAVVLQGIIFRTNSSGLNGGVHESADGAGPDVVREFVAAGVAAPDGSVAVSGEEAVADALADTGGD